MSKKSNVLLVLLLISSLVQTLFTAPSAYADGWKRRPHIEWTRGRWIHDRHDGRLGWWWVIGSSWYFFERPHTFDQPPQTVIVQQPQPVVIQSPSPAPSVTPVLYYCKENGKHYPEITTCHSGWSLVSATTPPQP